jgi:hypothetical protein
MVYKKLGIICTEGRNLWHEWNFVEDKTDNAICIKNEFNLLVA